VEIILGFERSGHSRPVGVCIVRSPQPGPRETDLNFPCFYVYGMLGATGWPRRSGLLRRETVNAMVLRGVLTNMMEWTAAFGATNPFRACQLFTSLFPARDWKEPLDGVFDFLSGWRSGHPDATVWNSLTSRHVPTQATNLAWSWVKDDRQALAWSACCASAVWEGLTNPQGVHRAIERKNKEVEEHLPTLRAAGLKEASDSLPSPAEAGAALEKILDNYETSFGGLPKPPPQLLALPSIKRRFP